MKIQAASRLSLLTFFVLLLAAQFLAARPLCAETRVIHGVAFRVDEITPVDSENVRVSIGGKEKIVAEDLLEDHILWSYFGQGQKPLLALDDTEKFVAAAAAAADYERAQQAFGAYLRHPDLTEARASGLVKALSKADNASDFFKSVLAFSTEAERFPRATSLLLYEIGLKDPEWLKVNALSYAFRFSKDFRALVGKMYRQALYDGDVGKAGRLTELEGGIFGFDDAVYKERRVLNEEVARGLNSLAKGELESVYPLVDLAKKDEQIGSLLSTSIIKAVHRLARENLKQGAPEKALAALSVLDLSWRTPTTHELIKRVLFDAGKEGAVLALDASTKQFLYVIAAKDAALKDAYTSYLEKAILRKSRENELAENLFSALLEVRPDPNRRNDLVRLQQALDYAGHGSRTQARAKVSQVKTGVPLRYWPRLFAAGVYVRMTSLFLVLLLLGAGGAVWYQLYSRSRENALEEQLRLGLEEELEAQREIPLFSNATGIRGLNPILQEYVSHLRQFGLEKDADLKSIKTAYRSAVKAVHPDLNNDPSGADSAKFIELTGIYERLLELRKEMGLPH